MSEQREQEQPVRLTLHYVDGLERQVAELKRRNEELERRNEELERMLERAERRCQTLAKVSAAALEACMNTARSFGNKELDAVADDLEAAWDEATDEEVWRQQLAATRRLPPRGRQSAERKGATGE